jgi:hypothetical protein
MKGKRPAALSIAQFRSISNAFGGALSISQPHLIIGTRMTSNVRRTRRFVNTSGKLFRNHSPAQRHGFQKEQAMAYVTTNP